MEIYQSIILGIVQGLTELLPISSSAHLQIIPWMFGWLNSESFKSAFEAFDVALHAGTLLAIGIFFFKDWIQLLKGVVRQIKYKEKNRDATMFWYLVIATIPGAIIGYIMDEFVGDALDTPFIIATMLIVMGILLYIVDKKSSSRITYEKLGLKETFLIGCSQALAFIPGVSRSGITMTVARKLGVQREAAAKYSFMLATPIVVGAVLVKMKDFVPSLEFFIGILTSFIVGIFVIQFLLKYLKKGSFKVFAIYRIIFAIIIIAVYMCRFNA